MKEQVAEQLRGQLDTAWIPALPADWTQARLFHSSIDMMMELWCEVDTPQGVAERVPVVAGLAGTLGRYQRACLTDEGSWISLEIVAVRGRGIEFRENRDQRVYWGNHPGAPWEAPAGGEPRPDDVSYRSEFGHFRYKRPPASWPAWLKTPDYRESPAQRLFRTLGTAGAPPAEVAGLSLGPEDELLRALVLRAGEAVPAKLAAVDSHALVDLLLGEDTGDAYLQPFHLAAFADEVVDSISAEIRRLPLSIQQALWRELSVHPLGRQCAKYREVDPDQNPGEIWQVVGVLLTKLVAEDLQRRFGVSPDWG